MSYAQKAQNKENQQEFRGCSKSKWGQIPEERRQPWSIGIFISRSCQNTAIKPCPLKRCNRREVGRVSLAAIRQTAEKSWPPHLSRRHLLISDLRSLVKCVDEWSGEKKKLNVREALRDSLNKARCKACTLTFVSCSRQIGVLSSQERSDLPLKDGRPVLFFPQSNHIRLCPYNWMGHFKV